MPWPTPGVHITSEGSGGFLSCLNPAACLPFKPGKVSNVHNLAGAALMSCAGINKDMQVDQKILQDCQMITWRDHCCITMHIKQASSSSPVKEINFVPSAQAFDSLGIMDTMSSLCNVVSSIDMEISLVVDEGGLLAFTSYRRLQLF